MLTRCPVCATTFRVTPMQLRARAGTVRCGGCRCVFNALDSLAEDPQPILGEAPAAVVAPDAPITPQEPPAAGFAAKIEVVALPAVPGADDDGGPIADTGIGAEQSLPVAGAASADGVSATTPQENVAEPDPAPAVAPPVESVLTDYLAGQAQQEDILPPARRWPWLVASMVAVIALLLQAAYYYRVELAVLQPVLRPALVEACAVLGCDLPRPRHTDTLSIESSDLRPEPEQPGRLTLAATLRSKAPFAQEWPMLELTLTDVADRTLAVKHFAAADYLPAEKQLARRLGAGFPARGEVAVILPLDVGDLPAAGYRLYVFYP